MDFNLYITSPAVYMLKHKRQKILLKVQNHVVIFGINCVDTKNSDLLLIIDYHVMVQDEINVEACFLYIQQLVDIFSTVQTF